MLGALRRRVTSVKALEGILDGACADLCLDPAQALSAVCVSYALLKIGAEPEQVSRLLSWREFEQLSASLLRASGYQVRENVVLTRPRAQLDVVATGASIILSIDCKHYRREHSPSSLLAFARNQLRRSGLLREKTDDRRLIASVILSVSEPEGKFVEGVAIVPIRALRSFLNSFDSYRDFLTLE